MSTLIEDAEDVCAMEKKAAKERPVLFSGSMVRAILSGSKSQTRRVVKHKWTHLWQEPWYATGRVLDDLTNQPGSFMEFRHRSQDEAGYAGSPASTLVPCPYGQPGDRLWVRETWQGPIMGGDEFENEYRDDPAKFQTPEHCFYAADGGSPPEFVDADDNLRCCWRPSIHMPRWACRIVLEIVSVRVERLQGISEEDAIAEGIKRHPSCTNGWLRGPIHGDQNIVDITAFPRLAFRSLWESINGPESWNANPWVWCITFRRVI